MITRRYAVKLVAAMTFLVNEAALAGGPPPVSRPQACAATYCVEVVPQAPYFPYQVETMTDLEKHTSRMVVRLRHGGAVAFQSRLVDRQPTDAPTIAPVWRYEGDLGISSACLTCTEPSRKKDQVLGVAITGIPLVRSKHLSDAMDVCYWPLNMASAGHGTGQGMTLGRKVCISDFGGGNQRK